MSVINITHYDLDGVGSAICLKKVYGKTTVLPTGYNKLLQTIIDVEFHIQNANILYITDLQLDSDCLKVLNEYIKKYDIEIHLYDHHQNIKHLIHEFCPHIIYEYSLKLSGTGLTYKRFRNYLKKLDDYKLYDDFFHSVNSFDLWDVGSQHFTKGTNYNDLFWEYKFDKFIDIYSNLSSININGENRDLNRIQDNKTKYFNYLKSQSQLLQNETWCISFADKYINELQMFYPTHKYYINITSKGNVSLRVNQKYHNIIPVFKNFLAAYNPLRGGGHEFIYSTQLSQNTAEILDIVKKFVSNDITVLESHNGVHQ